MWKRSTLQLSAAPLVLFGHYVSQPTRAIAWTLDMKQLPYKLHKLDPAKGDLTSDEFLAKFPMGYMPCIEEADGFRLSEANAILPYLASKHGWTDLYPTDLKRRAIVDQWLHWHHTGMRPFTTSWFRHEMRAVTGRGAPWRSQKAGDEFAQFVKDSMLTLTYGALKRTPFLAGDTVTLADICAYCELDQIEAIDAVDFTPWPEVVQWMTRMKALPKHDEVRQSLRKIAALIKEANANPTIPRS